MSDLASQVLTADDVFVSHVRSLQVDAERALAAMRRGDFRHVRELLGEKLREHTMPALACLNEIEGLRAESGERRAESDRAHVLFERELAKVGDDTLKREHRTGEVLS